MGKKIKYHHSYRFDYDDFKFFSPHQKRTLYEERQAANPNPNYGNRKQKHHNQKGKSQNQNQPQLDPRAVQSVQSVIEQLKDATSIISDITHQRNSSPPPASIMGGRNSQDKQNKGGQTE